MIKVYKAEFNEYTNCATKVIQNDKTKEYQDTDNGYLIIFDYDIPKYMNYGGGFKSLIYIGLTPQIYSKVIINGEGLTLEK